MDTSTGGAKTLAFALIALRQFHLAAKLPAAPLNYRLKNLKLLDGLMYCTAHGFMAELKINVISTKY